VKLLNSAGEEVETTHTDTAGDYQFTGVVPGAYKVQEVDPDDYNSTTASLVDVSVPGDGAATANFGDQKTGSISGVVFADSDGDGSHDAGEDGIENVTVELLDAAGKVLETQTTDTGGDYSFSGLTPGTYSVRETDPESYSSTSENLVNVNLPEGTAATANFGDQKGGSISGVVFNDADGDGEFEPGDEGIGNVTVELLDPDGTVVRTTLTDTAGDYQFNDVVPGNYTVRETDPDGYRSTSDNDADVTLPDGGSAVANFGDQQTGSVSGVVFSDADGDGEFEPGDEGIGNVKMELLGPGDEVIGETITDPMGNYEFTGVPTGSYTVRETDPDGYRSTSDNEAEITIPEGGSANANFGDQQMGSVSGVVFSDADGDGEFETGDEGIGNVQVRTIDSDLNVIGDIFTDPMGNYLFTDIPPGTYTVRETDPEGYTSTSSNRADVQVPDGGSAVANFGDQRAGSVSGTVFFDANGNAAYDTGEDGLGNVAVELLNENGDVADSALTDASGNYVFNSVLPGNYQVRETDPPGHTSTSSNTLDIRVPDGGSATANFGDSQEGGISGVVFNDMNGNKVRDEGEDGIANVPLELLDADGDVLETVNTDPQGSFNFSDIMPGTYQVRETDLEGYTSTSPNTADVTVTPNGAAVANFGDRQQGSVSGVVFNDVNGNKIRDPGEDGIGNVTILLLDSDGNELETATTDAAGSFHFDGLVPGDYKVGETDLPGYVSTSPNSADVTVPPSGSAAANFGDRQQGSVGGVVFNDVNGDKTRDPGEDGLGNVPVTLRDPDGKVIGEILTDPRAISILRIFPRVIIR